MQSPVEGPEQEQDDAGRYEKDRPGIIQEGSEAHGTETEGKDRKEATQKDKGGRRNYENCFQAAIPGTTSGNHAYAGSHSQQGPILLEGQVSKTCEKRGKRTQGKETTQEKKFYPRTGYHGCIHPDRAKEQDDKGPEMADFGYGSGSPTQKSRACDYKEKGRGKNNMQPSSLQGTHE
jgi:hypothetical protein